MSSLSPQSLKWGIHPISGRRARAWTRMQGFDNARWCRPCTSSKGCCQEPWNGSDGTGPDHPRPLEDKAGAKAIDRDESGARFALRDKVVEITWNRHKNSRSHCARIHLHALKTNGFDAKTGILKLDDRVLPAQWLSLGNREASKLLHGRHRRCQVPSSSELLLPPGAYAPRPCRGSPIKEV